MPSYKIKHKTTRYIALEILVLTWDRHKYMAELNHDHIPANEKNDIIDKNTLSQKLVLTWDRHKYMTKINHDHIPANEKNDIIDNNTLLGRRA